MKHTILCLLLLIGVSYSLQAQDKIVLRNGRTIEVKIHRSYESRVEYTYPGETSVYERPKAGISYIQYQDGRREICDESLLATEKAATSRTTSPNRTQTNTQSSSSTRNVISNDEEIYWQDVKTTFADDEVRGMRRLNRVSAVSNISYKDAVQQLKRKAAALGGTTVLVMDDLDDNMGEQIEVLGIAYRDENMAYTPRNANEQTNIQIESDSNARRRRIAQQMDGYNNESSLIFEDYSTNTNTQASNSRNNNPPPARQSSASSRQNYDVDEGDDAIYLLNGRVIRGSIEEFEPDDFVSIRTTTGRIYEYSMDDVRRITRAPVSNNTRSQARNTSTRNSSRNSGNNNSRSSSGYNDNYSITGYKGTFDVGYDMAIGGTGEKSRIEFHTSHGYQINEYLFAGIGAGLHMYSARDTTLKYNSSYPHYAGIVGSGGRITLNSDTVYMRGVDSSFMTLPIFIDIRGYYPLQNSPLIPFAMLRAGVSFNLSDSFGAMGIYLNPSVGVLYKVTPKIAVNFSVGYSYQSYGGIPKEGGYGYHYYKEAGGVKYNAAAAGGITFKLGVEF